MLKQRDGYELAELAHLVDCADESIIATRLDGTISRWNHGAERLYGYLAGEALDKPLTLVMDSQLEPFEREVVARICRGESVPTYETWRTTKEGARVDISTTVSAIRNAAGEVIGISRISRDITELKRSREELERLVEQRTIELCQSEALFRQLFEAAPVGVTLFREDGQAIRVNPAMATLAGGSEAQLLAQSFRQTPAWRDSGLLELAEKALASGDPQRGEFCLTTSFGKKLEVECEFLLPVISGRRHLMLVAHDVSQFRAAERTLKLAKDEAEARVLAEQQYSQVLETVADGFMVLDGKGHILEANGTYQRMSGYSRDELLGMRIADIDVNYSPEGILKFFSRLITTGAALVESVYRCKNGNLMPVEVSATWLPVDGGRVFAFTRDITERKRNEEEIRNLAFYDPLTHLPNRRLLLERLQQALVTSHRSHLHGALVFIDLDNFKQLNDSLGHDMGDHLLVEVAKRLLGCVREKDTVARLGGDEFIMMLEELDPQVERAAVEVEAVLGKIMEALSRPYHLGPHEYYSTPSAGVAMFCDQRETVEELLKRADQAMYQAKSAGRNTLRFFDPLIQAAVDTRATLELELRHSLRQNQITLHYQPQIDRAGCLVGAESLVRWNHPERGMVGPEEFIPFVEDSGLVLPLGQRILDLACAQLAGWRNNASLAGMSVAVNVSVRQFLHADFVPQIRHAIEVSDIRPDQLKLELTESLLLFDIDKSLKKMAELKAFGVNFSLDDFGTGYSSLSYLKRLPLEQLKIDRSFVRDILTSHNDVSIVRAIIAMGHSLGLQIVAEGVETAEQWEFLLREGCDIGQGYLFSHPVPVSEFELAWSAPQRMMVH